MESTINHTYVNGGEYRKKFDLISENKELNRLLFQLSKKMLEHRNGTEYEVIYAVDEELNSASEREAEKERILKEIKSRPSTIKTKKTGQKKIVFNFG